jgi:hypothetical protein
MLNIQNEPLRKLRDEKKMRLEKRFALMQMNVCVFMLGGYAIDRKTEVKRAPRYGYL